MSSNRKLFIIMSQRTFGDGTMPLTSLYTCSRCRKEFNFSNIKYDESHNLICTECMQKTEKLHKKQIQLEKAEEQEAINFICYSCRFKFSVKKGSQQNIKCPYCSKTKLMIVKKYKDENDLIKDSLNPRYDH